MSDDASLPLSAEEIRKLEEQALAAMDEPIDDDWMAQARRESFTDEMSKAHMSELITWRGRVPDDLAPILEDIIDYRRRHPDR